MLVKIKRSHHTVYVYHEIARQRQRLEDAGITEISLYNYNEYECIWKMPNDREILTVLSLHGIEYEC